MAIAYQSVGSVTYANGSSVTIPKPTGLSAGDLMVAIVHQKDVDTATCTRTGWTAIDTMDLNATSGDYAFTLYKVADSTDASASNFVFTLNRSNYVAGAIYRITGQAGSSIINAHNWAEHASNTTSHSYADTITPSVADCLLIMAVFNSGNTTNSGYSIGTDNPTWTESFDIGSAGAGRSFAGAYSNRPQTTATGNSASSTGANDYSSSTIIAIKPFSVVNTTLTASYGSYAYTGYATAFKIAIRMVASYGSYALTGFATAFRKGKILIASYGSYAYTGFASTFKQVLHMLAGQGSYTYTGYASAFKIAHRLVIDTGYYVYTGFSSILTKGYKIVASYGSYALTGYTALLVKGRHLVATTGYYVYTGFAVRFPRYWRNVVKNVESWLNTTKNTESWRNTNKTDLP